MSLPAGCSALLLGGAFVGFTKSGCSRWEKPKRGKGCLVDPRTLDTTGYRSRGCVWKIAQHYRCSRRRKNDTKPHLTRRKKRFLPVGLCGECSPFGKAL